MKLDEAERIAEAFVERIRNQCLKIEVVSSIRRGKAEVNDIDIVALAKRSYGFLAGMRAVQRGRQIIRFQEQGAKIDLYVAAEQNYEVLRLIRTGSAEHNVELASIAKRRGWALDFAK
jgi:DNA polymerase/3'-5' exonuclease PolX